MNGAILYADRRNYPDSDCVLNSKVNKNADRTVLISGGEFVFGFKKYLAECELFWAPFSLK